MPLKILCSLSLLLLTELAFAKPPLVLPDIVADAGTCAAFGLGYNNARIHCVDPSAKPLVSLSIYEFERDELRLVELFRQKGLVLRGVYNSSGSHNYFFSK